VPIDAQLSVIVKRVKQEAHEVKSFDLVGMAPPLPPFTPGSHIDIHIGPGLVRQYSLTNGPHERSCYRIAVKREPNSRGGSQAMHDNIREGQTLAISAPRNNFVLNEDARQTILVAGGIGITPLLSMLQHLENSGRSFELQYFSRSVAHTAFHAFLSQGRYAGQVGFHYALESEAVRAYLRKHLWHRQNDAHLYICGPRPFMDMVEQTAAATWPPESVHLEYFSADPSSLAGPREAFVVRLARTGGEYEIPAELSIVKALAKHGITIETSCEQGVCGTCLTGVLEGEIDHRDVFLTDEERACGDRITPCVSRCKSAVLVLDL